MLNIGHNNGECDLGKGSVAYRLYSPGDGSNWQLHVLAGRFHPQISPSFAARDNVSLDPQVYTVRATLFIEIRQTV